MTRILLGTHGGDTAVGAARIARQLGERLHAQLDAVAVYVPPPVIDAGYGALFVVDDATRREALQQLRADADTQLRRCRWPDNTNAECIEGPPARSILDEAHEHRSDLIVVGLGSHHVIDRAFGGETALRLAQAADVPVLAVPGTATELPHRVLAAIDFSPTSIEAATLAASWLTAGDVLLLAHVAPPSGHVVATAAARGSESAVPDRLPDVVTRLAVPNDVTVTPIELTGDPARAILDLADREHANLIALGSHGYGMWKRFMLGSVASKVLRLATCSVLVVRPVGERTEAAALHASRTGEQSTTANAS